MVAPGLVTPLAGVWIEISIRSGKRSNLSVTPLAGVWIEIIHISWISADVPVTPLAGVWIEMTDSRKEIEVVS